MTLEQRNIQVRLVRNVKDFVDGEEFEQANVIALEARLSRLKDAWTGFVVQHSVLMGETNDEATKTELERVFDQMDQDCIILETRLKSRIEIVQHNELCARAAIREQHARESESDGDSEPEGTRANKSNIERQHRENDEIQPREDAEEQRENPARNQHAQENVDVPEQLAQQLLQNRPIVVSCGGNRQVENTWGEFDGTWTHWQGFHDRFKAAVHDNNQIPSIFKFQYLMKSLKGQAKADLGEWPQTEAGYEELWERMKELYSQKYKTSMQFVDKFFRLPKLEKTSGFMLQKMCNTTHEVMRSLRTMKYPVDFYDLFFVYGIHERMDPETSRAWELERQSDTPTAKEILAFLDRQAKAAFFASKNNADGRKRASNGRDNKNDGKRAKQGPSDESKSDAKIDNRACKVCKGSHGVHKCQVFKKMTLPERKKCARDNELCYNCLNPSHSSRECKSSACRRCPDKKHNSLLCAENPLNRAVNSVQIKSTKKKGGKQEKSQTS